MKKKEFEKSAVDKKMDKKYKEGSKKDNAMDKKAINKKGKK